jgi:hypothetical protein
MASGNDMVAIHPYISEKLASQPEIFVNLDPMHILGHEMYSSVEITYGEQE